MMLHYSGSVPSQFVYNNLYPINYFHSPLKNEIDLAGNFGELRPNHFHSGWDIKTDNQIGYTVSASQMGFVSRIKLSKKGYGLAVYITHPNGFTTVYAHLSKLSDKLNYYLTNEQKKQNKTEIDFKLKVNQLKVKCDEFIAESGNSGSSEAPHLHFEIRDAFTEEAINPAFFGLKINDDITPIIKKIGVYSYSKKSENQKLRAINISANKNEKISRKIIVTDSIISFAINGFDKQKSKSKSELGFTSIELFHRKKNISKIYFDRLIFAENKTINNMIDTFQQTKQNLDWYKLFLPEQNISTFYKNKGNGIIVLKKNEVEDFEIVVYDFKNNSSKLIFSVEYKTKN
ncbi:MAG: hypothetical protein RL065_193 [Bacteroidota bacterium]